MTMTMNPAPTAAYVAANKVTDFFMPDTVGGLNIKALPQTMAFKKGEYIYRSNDKSSYLYLVTKGRIKVGVLSDDNKKIIKAVVQKGEIFGELALVGTNTRTDFAQAMSEVYVQAIPLTTVKELMAQSGTFMEQMLGLVGERLLKTQRRLEMLVFKDARSRIIAFLRDLVLERGRPVGYELLVDKFFTHQEIANLTDTSRQTVTTILNELRDENYIYFDRKRLLVRDVKKLSQLIL